MIKHLLVDFGTLGGGYLLSIFSVSNNNLSGPLGVLGLASGVGLMVVGVTSGEAVSDALERFDSNLRAYPLRRKIDAEPYRALFYDATLTTGARQLLAARYLRLRRNRYSGEAVGDHITKLHGKLVALERLLKNTPTFGAEFFIEKDAVKYYAPEFSMQRALTLANNTMQVAGNRKIRRSMPEADGICEVRINPSYAPITSALGYELFALGALPREVLVGYAVNIETRHYALPITLAHLCLGLTSTLPSLDKGYSFRTLDVYKGATVDPHSALLTNSSQVNLFTGVAGEIHENPDISPLTGLALMNDLKDRYRISLLPFLAPLDARQKWKQSIYDAFGIDERCARRLEERIKNTDGLRNRWHIGKDIPLSKIPLIKDRVTEINRTLEDDIVTSLPELYFSIERLMPL